MDLSEEHGQSSTDKKGASVSSNASGGTSVGWWWDNNGGVGCWWNVSWDDSGATWADGGSGGQCNDRAGRLVCWDDNDSGTDDLGAGLLVGGSWNHDGGGGHRSLSSGHRSLSGGFWSFAGASASGSARNGYGDTGTGAENLSSTESLLDLLGVASSLDTGEDTRQEGGSFADASNVGLATSRGADGGDSAGESAGRDLIELGSSKSGAGNGSENGRGLHFDRFFVKALSLWRIRL